VLWTGRGGNGIVGYALITSLLVAVIFTPYLGVVLLPELKNVH
jgi:multidrug efflux pump subunit AcrB